MTYKTPNLIFNNIRDLNNLSTTLEETNAIFITKKLV